MAFPLSVKDASPALSPSSVLVQQAFNEFCQLREDGLDADPEEFCTRYPAIQSSLRRAVETWLLLDADPSLLGLEAIAWPVVGDRFLDWVVEEELGRGAFARVYRAREPALGDRQVVLKVSPAGASEAWTLGRLSHDHVVPILTVREEPVAGLTVVCMPYLGRATLCHVLDLVHADGPPASAEVLARALASHDCPPSKPLGQGSYVEGVVALGIQIADALTYLHAQGVTHCDLKPSNVLLTAQGRAVLVDFNLSQDQAAGRTPLGGTPAYMAPEQLDTLDGQPTTVAPTVDLFALGVVLYELLAGRHPFGPLPLSLPEPTRRALLRERQLQGAAPLRSLNPRVPEQLEEIVGRCLARQPLQRYPSAAALAAALRRCQQRLTPRPRRRLLLVGLAGLASLTLVAAMALGSRSNPQEEARRSFREGKYDQAAEQYKRALEREPHSPQLLRAMGRTQQRRGNLPAALDYLEAASKRSPDGPTLAAWAYALSEQRHFEPARAVGLQAAERDAGNAALWNNLGYCALKLNDLDDAGRYLDRAIEADPRLAVARVNRAELEARRCARDPRHVPRQGIADLRQAEQLGVSGAAFHFLGAHLCALACNRGLDVSDQGLDWVRRAVAEGRSRDQLGRTLQPWYDRLSPEERQPRTPNETPLPTLADPLGDD